MLIKMTMHHPLTAFVKREEYSPEFDHEKNYLAVKISHQFKIFDIYCAAIFEEEVADTIRPRT